MKVDYNFLESKYAEIRQQIIDYIVKEYDLSNNIVIGIVDYENSKIVGEDEHNQVKALMELDLVHNNPFNIQFMAKHILTNDEGKYQLDKKVK